MNIINNICQISITFKKSKYYFFTFINCSLFLAGNHLKFKQLKKGGGGNIVKIGYLYLS